MKRDYKLQPRVIGKRGEHGRRVITLNGREYHVTKGWRDAPKKGVADKNQSE
jgi:hypothetical protein